MTTQTYYSLNKTEMTILLERASFEEMGMYLYLKQLANFRTGQVGSFRQQTLTYKKLGEVISRPASQGRPAIQIDRTQAQRIVEQLSRKGLVDNIEVKDGRLTLLLPMSPIEPVPDKKAAQKVVAANSIQDMGCEEMVSQEEEENPLEKAVNAWKTNFTDHSSVLISNTNQYNQSSSVASDDPLEGEPFPVVIGNTDWIDGGEETSPMVSHGNHFPHLPDVEEGGQFAAANLETQYKNLLRKHGYRLLDHKLSQSFFKKWAERSVSVEQVGQALDKVEDGEDLVPLTVHLLLEKSKPARKILGQKGRVCL